MAKIKTAILPLLPRTDLPDIKCQDGEIMGSRSDLLPELKRNETLSFPSGSELIGIHSPQSLPGSDYYFFISAGRLGYTCKDSSGVKYISGFTTKQFGDIKGFIPSGDVITLLADSSELLFLIFSTSSPDWIFSDSLPASPELRLGVTPAHLPGYTQMAGNYPAVSISLPLTSTSEISVVLIEKWLRGDNPEALSLSNRKLIVKTIYEKLQKYIEDAMNAGFFLSPVRVCAAFSTDETDSFYVPSSIAVADIPKPELSAVIEDFGWWNGILTLKVRFNLLPQNITIDVKIPSAHQKWEKLFPNLNIFIQSPPKLFSSANTENLTLSPRNYTLQFPLEKEIFSMIPSGADDKKYSSSGKMSRVSSTPVSGMTRWLSTLTYPDTNAKEYTPRWDQLARFNPLGIKRVDGRVLLFGGKASFPDEEGNMKILNISDRIYSADSATGLFFSNYIQLPGKQVLALSSRKRLLFCSCGIRKFNLDTSGNLSLGEWLGHPPIVSGTIADSDEGIYFISTRGIDFLLNSSKISSFITFENLKKGLIANNTLLAGEERDLTQEDIEGLYHDYDSDSLILILRGETPSAKICVAISAATGTISREGIMISALPYEYKHLLHLISGGYDGILTIGTKSNSESEEDDIWCVTRPLKLGNPFTRKKILAVNADAEGSRIKIEGSDNLSAWHTVMEGVLPIRSLHIPSHRYYRITLYKSGETEFRDPGMMAISYIS